MKISNLKFNIKHTHTPYPLNPTSGFTFLELVIVMGLILTLLVISTINLLGFQQSSSLANSQITLINDLKTQQLKAMNQEMTESTVTPYGIYFGTNSYTLFRGSTYSASDPNNFEPGIESGLSFENVEFAGNQIVFDEGSGEIIGFTSGNDSVTIRHDGSGQSQRITLNKLGVITAVEQL